MESELKAKESAYYEVAKYYCASNQQEKIQELIMRNMETFSIFTKTRAAKIIRQMIDKVAEIPNTEQLQISMCLTLIEWCSKEKKTYLKNKIQIRLAALYNQTVLGWRGYLLGTIQQGA